jgi:hypothetical protein
MSRFLSSIRCSMNGRTFSSAISLISPNECRVELSSFYTTAD